MIIKKIFSLLFAVSLILIINSAFALGQDKFPNKAIKVIYGYKPGSASHLSIQALMTAAEKYLGKPIVFDYKIGGGGAVGFYELSRSKPDGYTLGPWFAAANVITPHIQDLPYNTLKDFTPILQFAKYTWFLVVRSDSPWKNFQDLEKNVRDNPGKFTYGTAQIGSAAHLAMLWVIKKLDLKFENVPYQGSAPAVIDLLGGHISCAAVDGSIIPQIKSGKVRLIAILNYEQSPDFPDAPSLKTLGFDFIPPDYHGVAGPAAIPEQIVQILDETFRKAMDDEQFKQTLINLGMVPSYKNHRDFKNYIEERYTYYGNIMKTFKLGKYK